MAQGEISIRCIPFGQVCLIAEAYVLATGYLLIGLEDVIETIGDFELFLKCKLTSMTSVRAPKGPLGGVFLLYFIK